MAYISPFVLNMYMYLHATYPYVHCAQYAHRAGVHVRMTAAAQLYAYISLNYLQCGHTC